MKNNNDRELEFDQQVDICKLFQFTTPVNLPLLLSSSQSFTLNLWFAVCNIKYLATLYVLCIWPL